MTTTFELLNVDPQELQFPFELNKQISSTLQLTNRTDNYVAFKVKTTNPKKYCVRPNTGVITPQSTCHVTVTMQAQKEGPADMQCRDKFLLQSVVTTSGATIKDVTPDLFNKEAGNLVEEFKLKVNYVSPPWPPSPVREGSDEGSSPEASVSDNASRAHVEFQDDSRQATAVITRLTEERNAAIQITSKLRQEVEQLRRANSTRRGGIPLIYVIMVAVFGVLLGYVVKRT